MSEKQFDLVILGGGPGGYRAAERAGARGMSVALIEREELGGVCLNRGCIPTKSLLHSARVYSHAAEAPEFGVSFDGLRYELAAAMKWKNRTVETLRRGVASQMKRFGVEVVNAPGSMIEPKAVSAENTVYRGENVIIATGSSPARIPIPGIESDHVVTSREILQISSLPERLVVIGGGVIGMEFASYFSSVGVKVDVVEMLPEIVPVLDPDISKAMRSSMKNITFHLGARVTEITGEGVRVADGGSDRKGSGEQETREIEADMVLMSVGRRPNVHDIGLEKIGIDYSSSGIVVNERMQTNLPGVYAVGDVNGRSLLAHSAYRMGDVAVNAITGERDLMRYDAVPWVVYTIPEAAACGMTVEQAKTAGYDAKEVSMPLRVNGRFLAEYGRAPGMCKVVVDETSNIVLGMHIFGDGCSEIIATVATMIENELRARDVEEIIFPHPTVSEVIHDTIALLKE